MSARQPLEFASFPAALAERAPWGPYRAIIRHIVDADTLDVLIDLGFGAYVYETIRLRNVNAPERYTAEGKAAQAYVRALLPAGTPVVVTTYKDPQTFGRYVADIHYLCVESVVLDLGTHLVTHGMAVVSL